MYFIGMPKTRKHLKKRKKGRKNSIRGGACTTKLIVDTSGRTPILRTTHDNVLEGLLGGFGDMVGNLTFPHYNALAQTLSTVAENMVEDVMTEVLKEIDDYRIEDLVCEAFLRACYSTAWGSNPFINDSAYWDEYKPPAQDGQLNSNNTDGQGVKNVGELTEEQEDRYNFLKIYMKNLGDKSATDEIAMSFFSPEVFKHAVSNMDLETVADAKLKQIGPRLKKQIVTKINETTEKLKKPKIMEQLNFEWVDKEQFIKEKQVKNKVIDANENSNTGEIRNVEGVNQANGEGVNQANGVQAKPGDSLFNINLSAYKNNDNPKNKPSYSDRVENSFWTGAVGKGLERAGLSDGEKKKNTISSYFSPNAWALYAGEKWIDKKINTDPEMSRVVDVFSTVNQQNPGLISVNK
jgi:hypothetical protein